ncbi:alpha/beta hydrolase [Mycolicibacterium aubagnense]|uniref:Peptidase S9 prolyl oligopeptidase catalytic domain-containing protein n=1 Tax=Mycolicibacterium aubagnense TaxID=319707 RepID=A0ABN5YRR0_9MYCO|nr:hypothetical protein [Mycolicibacterium aubagnense]WGI33790.1 hypothetical protein QDT91_05340 [Mycolicibacterium aubagnense]BBX84445.1 hypothetical protein MAUB_23180 [Mycolicibacterium aubagnense]
MYAFSGVPCADTHTRGGLPAATSRPRWRSTRRWVTRPRSAERGPLLLTSGTEDHTVPLKVTKQVYMMYAKGRSDTEFHEFEGRGHSLTIDAGWRDVADVVLKWFERKGFLR